MGHTSMRRLSAVAALVITTGCGMLPGTASSGEPAEGPHRVAVEEPARSSGDGGRPAAVEHHWVGLHQAWQVEQIDEEPMRYGLVSDGERFVALRQKIDGDGAAEVTGYDGATGKRLWRKSLPWVGDSSPVAADGTIVVPLGRTHASSIDEPAQFAALDLATGEERWRARVKSRVFMTSSLNLPAPDPGAILDGVFYYADGPKLYGRDLATGKIRYQRKSKSHKAVAGPLAAGDKLVVVVKPDLMVNTEGIDYSIDSLAVLDKKLTPVRQVDFPKDTAPDAVVTGGDIAVAYIAGGDDPRMWAIDTSTGKRLWDQPLGEYQDPGPPLGDVLPIMDASVNHQQQFVGRDLLTGKQLWKLGPRDAENVLDRGRAMGVADGTLFGLGHGVEIVDPETGKVTFRHQFTPRGGGLVTAAGGRIVIYNHDGLMGFD